MTLTFSDLDDVCLIAIGRDLQGHKPCFLNIMESCGIYIENDEIRFKYTPPTSMII
jgi:hypothetical protein